MLYAVTHHMQIRHVSDLHVMRALLLQLTPGVCDNRYVKGKRLHDPQDITCIKLDETLQSVLRIDSFKVAEFASVLDNALEIAPSLPVRIRHRLSLTSAELKPTVVDVTISVASERALVIRDFSKNLQQVDAKLEEIMQQVSRVIAALRRLSAGLRHPHPSRLSACWRHPHP